MATERHDQQAFGDDLARTLEHLTRALLDPAPSRVERPRVAVVPAAPEDPPRELGDDTTPDQPLIEPIVLRPSRGVDLLAELAFLDR